MRAGRATALIACLAVWLWLLAAPPAAAEGVPGPEPPGGGETMVLDFGPRVRGVMELDDGRDPAAPPAPSALYTTRGPRLLDRVSLAPWPPAQGQTLVVWIVAHEPVTLSVSFLGRNAPVHGANGAGWTLAPVPPLQAAGYTPLTIRAGSQQLVVNVPIRAGQFETINIPAATAAPILSQTKKVNTEAVKVTQVFGRAADGPWSPRTTFNSPLHGEFRHTSAFGSRRTYGTNPALSAHAGEDFSAPAGTAVYAPADATVALAEKLFVRGNAIVLDHGNGVFTGYWHLSSLGVKAGQQVKAGELLGKVGSTGLSTGAHLHWEMRVMGVAVDPMQWVGAAK